VCCVCVSKQTVMTDAKYSFLRALVANVPDVHVADDDSEMTHHHQRRDVTRSQPHDVKGSGSRPRGRFVMHVSATMSVGVLCVYVW